MNERQYGYNYAQFLVTQCGEEREPVEINAMVTQSVDIPPDDYCAMRDDGIENPDPREYWRGYNAYMTENK